MGRNVKQLPNPVNSTICSVAIVVFLAIATLLGLAQLAAAEPIPTHHVSAPAPTDPNATQPSAESAGERNSHPLRVQAAPGTDFVVNGTRLHAGVGVRTRVTGLGYRGDRLRQLDSAMRPDRTYYCHRWHTKDPWWMKVRDLRTGISGWVPQCFINLRRGGTIG